MPSILREKKMYQWLYKETIETGIKVRLDEVQGYLEDGWLDTPDKWGKEGVVALKGWDYITPVTSKGKTAKAAVKDDDCALSDMTKNELELYAREQFNVELDKRKNKATLIKQIEALENGNSS